jgi:hypothetical protein
MEDRAYTSICAMHHTRTALLHIEDRASTCASIHALRASISMSAASRASSTAPAAASSTSSKSRASRSRVEAAVPAASGASRTRVEDAVLEARVAAREPPPQASAMTRGGNAARALAARAVQPKREKAVYSPLGSPTPSERTLQRPGAVAASWRRRCHSGDAP